MQAAPGPAEEATEPVRPGMTIARFAGLLARTLVGIAALGATCLVLIGQAGRDHHALDQINVLLPLLLVLLALLLASALRTRDRLVVAVAAIGMAVGGYQLGGAALEGWRDRSSSTGRMVKVVTLSAFHANPDPTAIRTVIAAQAPDIAVMQETNGTVAPVMDSLLPGYYRLGSCGGPHCTLTVLSRWPLRRAKIAYDPGKPHPDLLAVDVAAPFGGFRVITLHLPRPYDRHAQAFIRIVGKVARENSDQPLIVAGDFNTASGSFGLFRLAKNSGLRRRDGFIPTYPANKSIPAFAGIDHIFADRRWASAGCRRTAAGHSDHYGVACRLQLKPEN